MIEKEYKGKSIIEILEMIGNKNTISETEEKIVQYVAIESGFKNSITTCGIIYPEGRGQAFSCNQFAKEIVKMVK